MASPALTFGFEITVVDISETTFAAEQSAVRIDVEISDTRWPAGTRINLRPKSRAVDIGRPSTSVSPSSREVRSLMINKWRGAWNLYSN